MRNYSCWNKNGGQTTSNSWLNRTITCMRAPSARMCSFVFTQNAGRAATIFIWSVLNAWLGSRNGLTHLPRLY